MTLKHHSLRAKKLNETDQTFTDQQLSVKLNKAKMHFVKNSKDLIAVEISKIKSLLKGKFFRNGHNRKKSCHDICDSRISWVKLHQKSNAIRLIM